MQKSSTKDKIINAAWKLFQENGYENTTLTDIIKESHSSRGAFYHHFHGKEDLLFHLAYFFDSDYSKWFSTLTPDMTAIDKLSSFNKHVFNSLENSPYRSFFSELYGYQVMTSYPRYILNPDREYYRILNQLIKEGIEKKEIRSDISCSDLVHTLTTMERGYTYNWCLEKFQYSLTEFAHPLINLFLESLRPENENK